MSFLRVKLGKLSVLVKSILNLIVSRIEIARQEEVSRVQESPQFDL